MSASVPNPTPRHTQSTSPLDEVRVRRQTSGGDHYIVVEIALGTRLDHVASRLVMLDPSAVLVSVTGGTSGELLFRIDDPERVETTGSFNGFVSGGTTNIPSGESAR